MYVWEHRVITEWHLNTTATQTGFSRTAQSVYVSYAHPFKDLMGPSPTQMQWAHQLSREMVPCDDWAEEGLQDSVKGKWTKGVGEGLSSDRNDTFVEGLSRSRIAFLSFILLSFYWGIPFFFFFFKLAKYLSFLDCIMSTVLNMVGCQSRVRAKSPYWKLGQPQRLYQVTPWVSCLVRLYSKIFYFFPHFYIFWIWQKLGAKIPQLYQHHSPSLYCRCSGKSGFRNRGILRGQ